MGKDGREIVLSSGQKDRTLQNGRAEIHGLAVFHELLEQPQDLLVHWWASSCCKAAKILRSGCRRTLRFIILVGNVTSVIDNFSIIYNTIKMRITNHKRKKTNLAFAELVFRIISAFQFLSHQVQGDSRCPVLK